MPLPRGTFRTFTPGLLAFQTFMLLMLTACLGTGRPMKFPGPTPGRPAARCEGGELTLENRILSASWTLQAGVLQPGELSDKLSGQTLPLGAELFRITLTDGRTISSSAMALHGAPRLEAIAADPTSPRLADRYPGRQIAASLIDPASGLEVEWRAILREGANTIRQCIELTPRRADLPVREVVLLDLPLPGGRVSGRVPGSPIVTETLFMGLENPLSTSTLTGGRAVCALGVGVPLHQDRPIAWSSVVGVAPRGQLRRAVLHYVERERAHPYRPFLHYNTWYDLGYFSKYDEAGAVATIDAYGKELVKKRGVVFSSLLFDDGWDDTATIWQFHAGFPKGFAPVRAEAAKYGMGLGVWMSPFGGYGKPHKQRIETGKALGLELNADGFALSGPKYFEHFRAIALKMVNEYGVNMFKFDGLSRNSAAPAGSLFSSDFQAAIQLIEDLRAVRRDIFINLTTGTWPSPFWTLLADSIWRDGEDHDFAGVGSWRQKWITYRDATTYQYEVQAGPLYPLSSLMLHGVIYAKHARHLGDDPQGDLPAEVRSYFGGGTQLQELYVTPGLLKARDWDTLAASANWARKNADVLRDTHWVGGDPGKLQVYGWASWAPRKGILVLRNPADKEQTFGVDARGAFELPEGAGERFELRSPYGDQRLQKLKLEGATRCEVTLKPFEVLVFEGKGR